MRIAIFLLFIVSTSASAVDNKYLCHRDESVIFGCSLGDKLLSLCSSKGVGATTGYVQYRYGTINKIEMTYPKKLLPPKGYFFLGQSGWSGGGENRIRFNNGKYNYLIYDTLVKVGDPPSLGKYKFTAGVIVGRKNIELSRKSCKNLSSGAINGNSHENFYIYENEVNIDNHLESPTYDK